MLKVLLGGEGNNELGTRGWRPSGDDPGVLETLLRGVRPSGWQVVGAVTWKSIRKYRAGAARHYPTYGETYNIPRLILLAYEQACELLVFVRDVDGDKAREHKLVQALASAEALGFATEYRYELTVVGGLAKPNLDG